VAKNRNIKTKRLFLALWPEDETRQQILELQKSLKHGSGLGDASPVDENHIHITLHFLGSIPEQEIPILTQALDGVSGNAFSIELDRLGYFSKPKILWLGNTEQSEPLNALHKATGQAVRKCLAGYQQKKHVSHVTLFRKAGQLPQKEHIEPISWHANSFVLVESKTYQEGVQYRVLQQWPLMH
jgi:2'-5' RNA ligase